MGLANDESGYDGHEDGEDTSDVISHACSGGSERGGKELREIKGQCAGYADGKEIDERQDEEEASVIQSGRGDGDHRDGGGGEKCADRALAAELLAQVGHQENPDEGADVGDHNSDAFSSIHVCFGKSLAGGLQKVGRPEGGGPGTGDDDGADDHSDENSFSPSWTCPQVAEWIDRMSGGIAGGRFRLFDGKANEDADKGGNDADYIHVLPGHSPEEELSHAREGRAEGGSGLEDSGGSGPGSVGHDLGDQGGACGPFSADPQRDDKSGGGDLPDLSTEDGEAGEEAVDEDGEDQGASSAPAIGEDAEEQAPERPTEEEDSLNPTFHRRATGSVAFRSHHFLENRSLSEVEDGGIEDVKDPPEPSGEEDGPLESGETPVPGKGGVIGKGSHWG